MKNYTSFITKDELCKSILAYEKQAKKANLLLTPETFLPENATDCSRKILYKIFSGEIEQKVISESLTELKNKWISLLSKFPDVTVYGVDVEFSDIKYNMTGKADLVLNFENRNLKSILNIREADEPLIQKIQEKGPLKQHVISDMILMWMSEIPHAIMIYENINKKQIEVFHIVPYNSIIEEVRNKFQTIINYKLHNKIIDRPYKDQKNSECKNCKFLKKCWS